MYGLMDSDLQESAFTSILTEQHFNDFVFEFIFILDGLSAN